MKIESKYDFGDMVYCMNTNSIMECKVKHIHLSNSDDMAIVKYDVEYRSQLAGDIHLSTNIPECMLFTSVDDVLVYLKEHMNKFNEKNNNNGNKD